MDGFSSDEGEEEEDDNQEETELQEAIRRSLHTDVHVHADTQVFFFIIIDTRRYGPLRGPTSSCLEQNKHSLNPFQSIGPLGRCFL